MEESALLSHVPHSPDQSPCIADVQAEPHWAVELPDGLACLCAIPEPFYNMHLPRCGDLTRHRQLTQVSSLHNYLTF